MPLCRPAHLPRSSRLRRPGRETGSAYVVALLVLVVLTIFGLTLALMTQTEMQIAGSERVANRTLSAAESGISTTMVQVLNNNDCARRIWAFDDDTASSSSINIGSQVDVIGAFPTKESPCNLCQINQGSQYGVVDYMTRSTARRLANASTIAFTTDTALILGQQAISLMVQAQPIEINVLVDCSESVDAESFKN